MRRLSLRWCVLGLVVFLAVTFSQGTPTTYAAGGSIVPSQLFSYVVPPGLWHDSGATLTAAVTDPGAVTIQISDQSYLRTGWVVKVDSEQMLISELDDGDPLNPATPDFMKVTRAQGGTSAATHASGAVIQAKTISVNIMAQSVSDPDGYGLGAFKVYLAFPSNVQMIKLVADSTWLGSTGRTPYCHSAVETWPGTWEVECGSYSNPGVHSFTADAAVTTTNTTLTDTRRNWAANQWKDYTVTCNGKVMTVTSNTATTLTGASWSGGGNPGSGNAYAIHLPTYTADAGVTTTGSSGTADAVGTADAAGTADTGGGADVAVTTIGSSTGTADPAVTTTNTTLTDTRAAWTVNQLVGAVAASNGKRMTVTSNTSNTLTGTGGWSDGGNPGNGNAYTIGATLTDTRVAWTVNQWVGAVVASNGKVMTVTGNTATTVAGDGWSDGGNPGNGNAYTIAAVTTTGGSGTADPAVTTAGGSGTADPAVTTTNTTLTDTRAAWAVNQLVGAVATCNGKTMTVTSNTSNTLTGTGGWSDGGNPGNGKGYTISGTLTDTRQSWTANQWVGAVATCNGKTMTVTSNTATMLAGDGWSDGGNPGNGHAYTISGTLTDTRVAWTDNQWKGAVVTSNGKTMTVTSNTENTLTGAGGWSGVGNPGNGEAYTIAAVTTTNTTLTDTRAAWTVNQWAGTVVISNGKTMTVTGNTATTLTGSGGWSGGGNPGNGKAYTISVVTTTNTTLTDTRAAWTLNQWAGHVATSNGKTMTVTSNTSNTLTGTSGWSGGGNPGNGNAYTIGGTLTDSRRSWAVNQWKDYTVTSNGKTMTVTSNDATTLTGTGGWSGVGNPGNGKAYSMAEPGWYPIGPSGSGKIARVTLLPLDSLGLATVSLAGSKLYNSAVVPTDLSATVSDLGVKIIACPNANPIDQLINQADLLAVAQNLGDRGVDTGATLVNGADQTQTSIAISDRSLLNVNDRIAIDNEQMDVQVLQPGPPDVMTVARPVNKTKAATHLAGAHIFRATKTAGNGAYTPVRDVNLDGVINQADLLQVAMVLGITCPSSP